MNHIESQHGKFLMQWAKTVRMPCGRKLSEVMYHNPNGGKRSKIEAARMKAEGVRAGIPDYHIPVKVAGFGSMYLELKKPDAVPSDVSMELKLLMGILSTAEIDNSPCDMPR